MLLTIIQVIDIDKMMIGFTGNACGVSVDTISGKWAGPLVPPEIQEE